MPGKFVLNSTRSVGRTGCSIWVKISLDRSLDQLLRLNPRYVMVSCLTNGDSVGGWGFRDLGEDQ